MQKLLHGLYGTWQNLCPPTISIVGAHWSPQRSRVTFLPSGDSSSARALRLPLDRHRFPAPVDLQRHRLLYTRMVQPDWHHADASSLVDSVFRTGPIGEKPN